MSRPPTSLPSASSGKLTLAQSKPARIAVLLESSRAFGRGVLQGLVECLQVRRHWMVYYQEGGLGELLPGWFAAWQGDGVIARIEDQRMAAALVRKRIPVVDIRGRLSIPGIPVVKTDNDEIARMTADHLIERGFRQFAFCGYEGAEYSTVRRDAFAGLNDVRNIRFAIFVQWCRDANDDRVHGAHFRKIGRSEASSRLR